MPPFQVPEPPALIPRVKPTRGRKNMPGKAPVAINWSFVALAFQAGSTQEEVAAFVGVTAETLRRRIKKDLGKTAAEVSVDQERIGKMHLRIKQHRMATKDDGNVQMLVWLGKNRLGQAEKVDASGTLAATFLVMTREKMAPDEWERTWAGRQGPADADANAE